MVPASDDAKSPVKVKSQGDNKSSIPSGRAAGSVTELQISEIPMRIFSAPTNNNGEIVSEMPQHPL